MPYRYGISRRRQTPRFLPSPAGTLTGPIAAEPVLSAAAKARDNVDLTQSCMLFGTTVRILSVPTRLRAQKQDHGCTQTILYLPEISVSQFGNEMVTGLDPVIRLYQAMR